MIKTILIFTPLVLMIIWLVIMLKVASELDEKGDEEDLDY